MVFLLFFFLYTRQPFTFVIQTIKQSSKMRVDNEMQVCPTNYLAFYDSCLVYCNCTCTYSYTMMFFGGILNSNNVPSIVLCKLIGSNINET